MLIVCIIVLILNTGCLAKVLAHAHIDRVFEYKSNDWLNGRLQRTAHNLEPLALSLLGSLIPEFLRSSEPQFFSSSVPQL